MKARKVQIGDLVRNLHSESRMTGVVISFYSDHHFQDLVVLWADGRRARVKRQFVEIAH